MTQKSLAKWVQGILIGFAVVGAIFYLGIIPMIGKDIAADNPEMAWMYYPWLVFLLLTAVPCYIFLVYGWKIAGNISKERKETAK